MKRKANAKCRMTAKCEVVEVSGAGEVSGALFRSIDDYVARFGERFSVGLSAIAEAGRIYAEALRKHPTKAASAFSEKYPSVSERTWNMLRAIGNGDLNPGAMILLPKVADRVKKLSRKQQDALFRDSAGGIQIVRPGDYSVVTVDLGNMTNAQLSIALDEQTGRLRSTDEQKEFLVKAMQHATTNVRGRMKMTAPYRVVGRVMIVGKVEIGLEELKAIVATMERGGKSKK